MKSAMFTIALLMAGAAFAQDHPATAPDPAATSTPSLPDAMAGQTDMPIPMGPTVQTNPAVPPSGEIVAPGNTAPKRDARGIAVVSDAAVAPLGFNQAPGVPAALGGPFVEAPANALATQPATESYPACTAVVTDNCVQTYERGRSPQ